MGKSEKRTVAIIGAGPAGLTAGYELLERSKKYRVMVFEETDAIGGISRTVNYKGNRMDMGGHRFFSKVPEVNDWWEKMMPTQGAPAYDDKILGHKVDLKKGGPDPEKDNLVMLRRNRLSRILFNGKFFDYPLSLKLKMIKRMGFGTTLVAGCSYLKSMVHKRLEKSLEDFYINRFGKKLYMMFFEGYTEKLWGRHPRDISPEWGAQRVKGLSVAVALRDAAKRMLKINNGKVETSLIEEFIYPKYGPGQMWETVANEIKKKGGEIQLQAKVVGIKRNKNKVIGVVYEKDGKKKSLKCDYVISSMPIKDLVMAMDDSVPKKYEKIAKGLPYRDYMTVGVLVKRLALKNQTKIKTLGGIIPDDWIYIHDKKVRMGRMQIYNNWSPYLVKDVDHTVWVGLEYFCNEGDDFWEMTDDDFAKMAISEMEKINIIDNAGDVLDSHVERVKKAYPAYFDAYEKIDELRDYLDRIPNLFLVGRNGQHRYNNMDHSMCTSFEAVRNILSGETDKTNIWDVNTEKEYHESRK